jgi:uncharacterized protein
MNSGVLSPAETPSFWRRRSAWLVVGFGIELTCIALLYQFLADIECGRTGALVACDLLRSMVLRAVVVLAVAAILIRARPADFAGFLRRADGHQDRLALGVHLVGVALMLVPLVMTWGGDLSAAFTQALIPWSIGALAAFGGGLLWLAPKDAWSRLLWHESRSTVPILIAAALVPDLAYRVLPIWDWQALTAATFAAVAWCLNLVATGVEAYPEDYIIGVESFFVSVAPQCSGVEGFALVTAFIGIYVIVFRSEIRLARFLLVIWPLGLALSWALNILRITVLILIGARLSPDVAVNGFHSYAGWLLFTLLAFVLIAVVQTMPWLHREGLRPVTLPLRTDPVAAQILPFVAFMVTGTFLSAVLVHPGLGMPFTTVVLALAALFFLPVYRTIAWRPDPLALLAGAIVGVGWVLTAPAPDTDLQSVVAGLSAAGLAVWAVARVLGTVVMVPLVEEMFFRGYLLRRLDGPQLWRRMFAIAVSSLAFAALHGRWVEAGLAGLVFAALMLRRGRVADAVWGHVVANAVVAAMATANGDWSLI